MPTNFWLSASFVRKPRFWETFLFAVDFTSYHDFQFGTNRLAAHFSKFLEPWRLQI
jgi:hypothetical protein